ncbi:exonuclease SbcD [Endozoicomonas montiporae]|uniref:Nuclease SbcCD subunit D n=2 Tax=Endozoicomonas montiporae TaxID=1027273 RepID=A0A081N0Q1_9GAMM|nr:exonuclease subunit SbcD [Endozoicomonas montiporae]AMO54498.1 nuclease SbcCD subunit D [Endozoicomonas montiporae CL-33]KEQ12024.1 exonuclease SbcD [Endozoicomonas montiporae]
MRILHTSDWHLGQHFMGKSREAEHEAFLNWLLATVNDQAIDAVIIAGDVFDTGTPPSYARSLYNQFIVNLQQTCCQQLIIVGGNHDSVSTLNESRELLALLNTTVVGGVSETPDDEVVLLNNADNEPSVALCAIPFIRPRDVLESQSGDSDPDKKQALQNAIASHYQTAFSKAKEHNLPVVATGHLTTVNGQLSESVREIYIGTLHAFPASGFPPADYIALGHLHKPQTVAGQDHIRYSGSPIPLSFDETATTKQVIVVTFTDSSKPEITEVPVPAFRTLLNIKGSLQEIEDQINQIDTDSELNLWLDIVVASDDYLSDIQGPVQDMVTDLPVEVLRIRRQRQDSSASLTREANETLEELDVSEVFSKRLIDEPLKDDKVQALTNAFHEVLSEIHDDEQSQDKSKSKQEVVQ